MSTPSDFNPHAYGQLAAELLAPDRLPELGPGTPNRAVRDRLAALTPASLLGPHNVADADMARACISGLWLYHDFLDESHTLSQSIGSTTGSYWHGIMHRREPDFENAKYWFRRVGSHPVFEPLVVRARGMAAAAGGLRYAAWMTSVERWDPFAFVDTCRDCFDVPGPDHELCRRISLLEWQLLFDFSYRKATARSGS